ncbi:MAG TPA: sigma-70 family RNA polymerase sigma factor, partial [Pengzhenrongella sp.]
MSVHAEHQPGESDLTIGEVVPQPCPLIGPDLGEDAEIGVSTESDDTFDLVIDLTDAPVAHLIKAAWREFKVTGDRALRERLILHYAPLVTAVAGRLGMRLPSSVERADLVSYGMFGLIDAIEKYELDRAVKFETYASARIRGAIIDELRAIDWIPRSVRTKARAVDRAYADLEGELRRTPSEVEVAGRLEV